METIIAVGLMLILGLGVSVKQPKRTEVERKARYQLSDVLDEQRCDKGTGAFKAIIQPRYNP